MKKFLLLLLVLFLIFACAAVLVLGYLGAVPGLADILGANKPRDLGVEYTRAEFDTHVKKSRTQVRELPEADDPGTGIVFAGQTPLTESFTQEEMSARSNYARWAYMPVTNSQIRIQGEGGIEFSGNLQLDHLVGFISATGGEGAVEFGTELVAALARFAGRNPPIYLKATASVTDNKSDISLTKIQLGRFGIPLGNLADANEVVEAIADHLIGRVDGLDVKSVTFRDGRMFFEGSVPESVMVR